MQDLATWYVGREFLCFGNELRVAFLLEQSPPEAAPEAKPRNVRRFYTRPAIEPMIYSLWPKFAAGAVSIEDLEGLVSLMEGRILKIRDANAWAGSRSEGPIYEFIRPPEFKERLLEAVNAPAQSSAEAVRNAVAAYVEVLLCHAFEDANGRLARAVFQGLLSKAGLSCPCVPIGPVMYRRSWALTPALSAIGRGESPRAFVAELGACVQRAVGLARNLQADCA